MEDDFLFTVKEYAALLKLSESTVYRNPAKSIICSVLAGHNALVKKA